MPERPCTQTKHWGPVVVSIVGGLFFKHVLSVHNAQELKRTKAAQFYHLKYDSQYDRCYLRVTLKMQFCQLTHFKSTEKFTLYVLKIL